MKKVLTIAGSDSSGGAGIQADIKTITAHKMYAMSAITALTAQNTTGFYGVMDADADFVKNQIDCIFTDIRPDAVKIGMVSNIEIIKAIAEKLIEYKADNIVVDPVMVATSGSRLISEDAMETLIKELLPLGSVIKSEEDMIKAAEIISENIDGAILIKGGHYDDNANDLLYDNGNIHWFKGKRVDTKNTHGTGCTLSSAIACNLAAGYSKEESIKNAKEYITGALKDGLDLGKGSGPLNHMYNLG